MKCYVWSVLLYGCETWTMGKTDEMKIQAAEMWFYRRMLKVSWTQKRTNEEVLQMAGADREMIINIRRRQMTFLGHIMRREDIEALILSGKIEGKKTRGRPRVNYLEDMHHNAGLDGSVSKGELLQHTKDRLQWKSMVANVRRDMAPW